MLLRSGRQLARYAPKKASMWGKIARSPLAQSIGVGLAKRAANYLGGSTTTSSGSTVTTQHDSAVRYRKKRMPSKKRKRWVRFAKRVRAVELSEQPLQFYDAQTSANYTTSADQQNQVGFMLGGVQVGSNDELYKIFVDAYNVASATAAASYQVYMKSMCLDMQIANTGTNSAVVDVYRLRCRKAYPAAVTPQAQYTSALTDLVTTTGGGTVTATKPSLTPFDCPNFCSFWQVMNKTEYIVSAGQVITLQMRNPRNRKLDGKLIQQYPQGIAGYTTCLFVQWRGVPINNAGTAQLGATAITISTQTSVKYAIPPGKTAESGRTV